MMILRHFSGSFKQVRRYSLLKFVAETEKREGQVGPAFFTKLVKKAASSQEIKELIAEAENRFGKPLPWQLLASASHSATSQIVSDPELGLSLLRRIPPVSQSLVHEGVGRSLLGCASRQQAVDAARFAYEFLSPQIRNATDVARLVHAGVDTSAGKNLIEEVLSSVAKDIDIRVVGVFLKQCSKVFDVELAIRIWNWSSSARKDWLSKKVDVVPISIQFLQLCAVNLDYLGVFWEECRALGIHTRPELFGAMLSVLASHGKSAQINDLLNRLPPRDLNEYMLTAILTSYSHTGLADEAWAFLKRIKQETNIGGLRAYTAVVDAFARKGEFDAALAVMEEAQLAGITPDAAMWMTVLSPCRRFGELNVAKRAFGVLRELDFSSEEMAAAAYVVMADVYRVCDDSNGANLLHAERISRGLTKERGAVTLAVKDRLHTFFVNEIPAELKEFNPKIESKLNEWSVRLASLGVPVESIQCRHSEKLALAYAVCIGEKHIVMRKNLRICSACHEASITITSFEDIVIQHWDRTRVHLMKSGKCSCEGFY